MTVTYISNCFLFNYSLLGDPTTLKFDAWNVIIATCIHIYEVESLTIHSHILNTTYQLKFLCVLHMYVRNIIIWMWG